LSGIVKAQISSLFPNDVAKGRIDWAEVHPTVSSYMDLWQSPYDTAYGPVARQVLKQSSQTKLMVYELAQAPNIDKELQVGRLRSCMLLSPVTSWQPMAVVADTPDPGG
jgi:hypothetical protein